jgi:hypothetical protein
MKATEFVAGALTGGKAWMIGLLADLENGDLVAVPTAKGGNHPLWVVGHLTASEASIVSGMIKGEQPNLPEGWNTLFGMGSQPVSDASKYPSKAELLAAFETVRAETLELLAGLADADLDKPSASSPNPELFGTVGRCLATLVNHQGFHVGQIADARRALGRKPAFA